MATRHEGQGGEWVTADLQAQARALGDPTRHSIFRHIVALDRPVGIAELNDAFPLNHNAIRQHVSRLADAGLVVESVRRSGAHRGRPPLQYTVNPAVEGRWGTTGPYERLSAMLVEVVRTGLDPVEVGRRVAGMFRAPASDGGDIGALRAAMARDGFEPEVQPAPEGIDIVLHCCPFASAVQADPNTVCSLHLGMAERLADDGGFRLDELVADDPGTAPCRLRLRPRTSAPRSVEPAKLSLRRRRRPPG